MPEMPEVTTAAKYINQDVQNKRILEAKILVPKMIKDISVQDFEQKIENKLIYHVVNIGKHILFVLEDDLIMISHLRMEGRYHFAPKLQLNKHAHAWFRFEDGYLIFQDTRKFGTFNLRTKANFLKTPPLSKLGFFAEDIEPKYFYYKLKQKTIAIKSALLDQTLIIGLGNIYVDEVLWASKIHPELRSNQVTFEETKIILENIQNILTQATLNGGSSIKTYVAYNTITGNHQHYLKVHTKKGMPCFRCQDTIVKTKVNGRGTYYCPTCQQLKELSF